ncbi:hypothetical protein K8942_00830 [Candidatus Peribacteria bacterium]|nr:MAG: hypothetical protein K8942_00830 [Candidatus Peribacteria bacterium]
MHAPSSTIDLPSHIQQSSWVSHEDVQWLRTGFHSLNLSEKQLMLDRCLARQRSAVFSLMESESYERYLLMQYLESTDE